MERRTFIKSVASLPLVGFSSPVEIDPEPSDSGMSGVWKRRTETGILLTEDGDQEYDHYPEWHREAVSASREYDIQQIAKLFDLRLISLQTDHTRWRVHYAHENGLEITIKRDTEEEVEYDLVATHIDEPWEDHRHYASNAQIAIAERVQRERDKYL
jgi:hypothetical protein